MNGLYYNDFSRYISCNLHFSFPKFQKSRKNVHAICNILIYGNLQKMINLIGERVNPIIETQTLISNYELTRIAFFWDFWIHYVGIITNLWHHIHTC
jgi:hypothetical protein